MVARKRRVAKDAPVDRLRELCSVLGSGAMLLGAKASRGVSSVPGVAAGVRRGPHPSAVIFDAERDRLVLVAERARGIVATTSNARRWLTAFAWWDGDLAIVTAFGERGELADCEEMPGWDTFAWFAAEPKHFVHFDSRSSLVRSALAIADGKSV